MTGTGGPAAVVTSGAAGPGGPTSGAVTSEAVEPDAVPADAVAAGAGQAAGRPVSRVRLHELALRQDGDEWIVGRMATGTFVAVPPVGARAIGLLAQGLDLAETAARLRAETGEDVDVAGFADGLAEWGFVAEADGRPVPSPPLRRPSLPWLKPRHVRFTLSPWWPLLAAALIAAAALTLLRRPELLPCYRSLLWSPHGSLVLALGAASGWSLLLLHELAHLVTARATGVPGRIRLGTRLQFLVMQTDISGIELAPRRHRLTAYLAGLAVNLSVASCAVLLLAAATPGGGAHRLLSAAVLIAVLPLPFQLLLFTRTDLYFVLQDLTGCRDLYGDGLAYAKYTAGRLLPRAAAPGDPSTALPPRERRAVRLYSVLLVAGSALCLGFMATVTLPGDLTLLARAALRLGPGHPDPQRLDGLVVLLVLGGVHVLWAVTWLRNRRARSGPARGARGA